MREGLVASLALVPSVFVYGSVFGGLGGEVCRRYLGAGAVAIRRAAGKAATPAARCGNSRRAIFIAPGPSAPSYIKFAIVWKGLQRPPMARRSRPSRHLERPNLMR